MYEFPIKYKGAKKENVIENMAAIYYEWTLGDDIS